MLIEVKRFTECRIGVRNSLGTKTCLQIYVFDRVLLKVVTMVKCL